MAAGGAGFVGGGGMSGLQAMHGGLGRMAPQEVGMGGIGNTGMQMGGISALANQDPHGRQSHTAAGPRGFHEQQLQMLQQQQYTRDQMYSQGHMMQQHIRMQIQQQQMQQRQQIQQQQMQQSWQAASDHMYSQGQIPAGAQALSLPHAHDERGSQEPTLWSSRLDAPAQALDGTNTWHGPDNRSEVPRGSSGVADVQGGLEGAGRRGEEGEKGAQSSAAALGVPRGISEIFGGSMSAQDDELCAR